MPDLNSHIDKARHNEDFYSSFDLNSTPYLDWVVNGIFYSALHYVDSYLANISEHPGDHGERIRFISNDLKLGRSFYVNYYRPLKDDSEEGRYNTRVFTPDEIRYDIMPLLFEIKKHLRKYVSQIS